MKDSHSHLLRGALVLLALLGMPFVSVSAQSVHLQSTTSVAEGLHPWYEITSDPEEPKNLIICGTKWDALANTPYGFVYASSNSGSTWQDVLEDRNSAWVTEHSCAWGQNHRAYFISEASKVIDGQPHHELGMTRLFVSTDFLRHWTETIKTGWADYSTSAVDSLSGRLYTFFNASTTRELARHWGNSIGLLVFSPDGKRMAGPFFCPGMRELDYHGVYPSGAVALNSGGVASLYHSTRQTTTGWEEEIGVIRTDKAVEPSLDRTTISHTTVEKDCLNFDDGSLAYDRERNRLFVAYVEGCKDTRILLTSSDDQGRTWARGVVVAEYQDVSRRVMYPSLVVGSGGVLGLLWSGLPGRWFFAQIQDKKLIEPPIELSGPKIQGVSKNSLWTSISHGVGPRGGDPLIESPAPITVDARNLVNTVWRESGLIAIGDKILAIWPFRSIEGMRLNSGVLSARGLVSNDESSTDLKDAVELDVTQQVAIVYGGKQDFDNVTRTLTVCLALVNRGNTSIRLPVKLEVTGVESPAGSVSILNATNSLGGEGTIWDISNSVTGDRIPPGTTSNPFCLSFHIDSPPKSDSLFEGEDLLTLKMRVLGSSSSSSEDGEKPQELPTVFRQSHR